MAKIVGHLTVFTTLSQFAKDAAEPLAGPTIWTIHATLLVTKTKNKYQHRNITSLTLCTILKMAEQTPVWFITAASSGFGHYLALEALARGHHVIASGRTVSKLDALKKAGAHTVALDVISPLDDIKKVAKDAVAKYGYITHLVNAAGYVLVGAVEETSPTEDYDSFNTNVIGVLNVTKAFLPYLRDGSGHRTICNFGSIASWTGGPGAALYYSAKWAVSGLSEALREEVAPFGIAVTVAEPGYFRTGFLNPGAAVQSKARIQAYEESAAGRRGGAGRGGWEADGDVGKGCKILVDILTKSGVGEGKEVPVRVALGSDSPPAIREKIRQTEKLLDEWEGVTMATDHED
ncbi:uncharacterized protein N0V89_004561 [Didymosphaeria variabile]|uniref:NAD(P)-binding protein n=1 Tax=Didymosphaeria variabile TaxID=1932322 RepID=A0A9W8XQL9_9PLEO|nr:uncharacterized protein N0V89_004561 [Didymosphaeria variabile]KAJ4356527.1 hypothetical protein N0V89_004561 [Didymosphaeria variabile]